MLVSLTVDRMGRHWKHNEDVVREQESSAWLWLMEKTCGSTGGYIIYVSSNNIKYAIWGMF